MKNKLYLYKSVILEIGLCKVEKKNLLNSSLWDLLILVKHVKMRQAKYRWIRNVNKVKKCVNHLNENSIKCFNLTCDSNIFQLKI